VTGSVETPTENGIGVVVPTLDEERLVAGCLESLGPDPDLDVVVSDGGSTDRTLEIVVADPRVRVVNGPRGRGDQLNRGARAVRGGLLLFLHADCRLPAGWRSALEEALADPATALTCFHMCSEPVDPGAGPWRRRWLRLLDLRSHGLGLPYGDQGFALRREVFERLGGFPEIPIMEDVALARAARKVGRIRRLPLAVRTTARRFERHPVRTRLMTATFPSLFRLGVSPHTLAAWYRDIR